MVSHNEQGQITLGWKSSQNLQGPHLHYPEYDLLSALHGLPRAAWCYPPLHRVQCLCQAEDISSQEEWYESRCRERLWALWALGNISQRPAARFLVLGQGLNTRRYFGQESWLTSKHNFGHVRCAMCTLVLPYDSPRVEDFLGTNIFNLAKT